MQRLGVLAFALALGAGCTRAPHEPAEAAAPADKVILLVNGEPIHQGELEAEVKALIDRSLAPVKNKDEERRRLEAQRPSLERDARESLITRKAIEQAITRESARPDDAQVSQTLQAVEGFMKLNGSSLDDVLRQSGSTTAQMRTEVRERLSRQALWDKMMGIALPTEPEIEHYYQANQERYTRPAGARVSQIFLPYATPDKPGRREQRVLRRRCAALRRELDSGADFNELAQRQAAKDPAAASDLGWVGRGSPLPPAVIEAAFRQEIGVVGDPVEASDGWRLLLVKERRPAQLLALGEIHDIVRSDLMIARQSGEVPALIKKLRDAAKVTAP